MAEHAALYALDMAFADYQKATSLRVAAERAVEQAAAGESVAEEKVRAAVKAISMADA